MKPDSSPRFGVLRIPLLLKMLLVFFILFVLVGLLLPVINSMRTYAAQTKMAAQAKQIALALKLYAGDHDGVYPAGVNVYGQSIRTSNDAFRSLIPKYVRSETIFGNDASAYQTAPPDNRISPAGEILRPGENTYAYIMGLTETWPPETPLIADGTDGTGRGYYVSDPKARGGLWRGDKALVIRLDNSARYERLSGPSNTRYIPWTAPDGTPHNRLSPVGLRSARLLDPAVAPSPSPPKQP
jgi:type II secretory pathway pseudopilin PulG